MHKEQIETYSKEFNLALSTLHSDFILQQAKTDFIIKIGQATLLWLVKNKSEERNLIQNSLLSLMPLKTNDRIKKSIVSK